MLKRSLLTTMTIGLGLLISSFLIACDATAPPSGSTPPARIILIVIDTLRQDHVSAYGGDVATPNIDALAERGQIFPNAVSSYFQTTMSMGSLFTGRTPSLESLDPQKTLSWNGRTWCGMRRFSAGGADAACIPESLDTLAESLAAADYHTIGITNNALLFRPLGFDQGFDQWLEVGKRTPEQIAKNPDEFGILGASLRDYRRTFAAVEAGLDARTSDRFFLYVHLMDVHDYALMKGQSYGRAVTRADLGVGKVVEALEERGLLKGSAILLTSDHGERLGEEHFTPGLAYHFGHPSFEEHIRIPMIVTPPLAEDTDQTMRSDDVYRLVLRIAGVSEPDQADLRPDELFVGEELYQIYRQGDWKSFVLRATGAHSLIDLAADPQEQLDVSADHPEILERHLSRINELSTALNSARSDQDQMSEEDERRLRALGYLE